MAQPSEAPSIARVDASGGEASFRSEPVRTLTTPADFSDTLADLTLPYLCVFVTAKWCIPCQRVQAGWSAIADPDRHNHAQVQHQIAFVGMIDRIFGMFDQMFAVADLTNDEEDLLAEALTITTLPTFVLFDSARREVACMHISTVPIHIANLHACAQVGRAEGAAHKRPARRLYAMLKVALDSFVPR